LAETLVILSDVLGFPDLLQENALVVPHLGHRHFFPDPSEVIIYQLSCHPMLYSLGCESTVK
jgi:hypothetical protein